MRRVNAILTGFILALFVAHMIWGGLILCGITPGGGAIFSAISGILTVLVALHMALGIYLTAKTLRLQKKAGVSYPKENKLFWLRRISGFALMLFLGIHVWLLSGVNGTGGYMLRLFDGAMLITQLALAICLLIHLSTNIMPLRIALGLADEKKLGTDVLIVLTVLLLLAGVAFVIYFLRWAA